MKDKYSVLLRKEERELLKSVVLNGSDCPTQLRRASILLLVDENYAPVLPKAAIARICRVNKNTVYNVCKRFLERGCADTVFPVYKCNSENKKIRSL